MVVALFAALIAPWFIDWTDFRKEFEREASRIMGKPVVVHGSVDARLIPFPTVTLNDVRVGASQDGEPLIQVAQFSMSAELAPFLSGEAPAYADYALFSVYQWARIAGAPDALAEDPPLAGWFDRLLDLNDGFARKTPAGR